MVQIAVSGGGKLQRTETDVVERFVIDAEGLIGVLDKLVHRKGGVVRFDDGVRHLEWQLN